MEPKFQSSFIPKGPIGTAGPFSSTSKINVMGIFGFLAIIVFILAVVASIGVFAYDKYLVSSISQMGSDLEAARATLEPESIKELTRLNSRLVITQDLLSKHTVLSPLFDFLESSTVSTVRFTDFTYSTTEKGLTLFMKGQARGYTAVALQADVFSKSPYIINPIFGDLSLDNNGNVVFSFTSGLDPSVISYKKQFQNITSPTSIPTSAPVVIPVPTSTPIATTTATSSPQR